MELCVYPPQTFIPGSVKKVILSTKKVYLRWFVEMGCIQSHCYQPAEYAVVHTAAFHIRMQNKRVN